MRALIATACGSFFLYAWCNGKWTCGPDHLGESVCRYVPALPTKAPRGLRLFASSPATSTFDIRDSTRVTTYPRRAVLRTHRAAPQDPGLGRGAYAAPVVACVTLIAAAFGRLRSRAAIVTMLAEGEKEVSLPPMEDACDIGTSLANGVCLSSTDGLEAGSVAWVLGSRRKKLPRVNLANLLRRNASAGDGNECDISLGAMDMARCMDNYDPLSLTSSWVTNLTMLAAGGKELALAPTEDACDIGTSLANGVCLSSTDGLEMGSVAW